MLQTSRAACCLKYDVTAAKLMLVCDALNKALVNHFSFCGTDASRNAHERAKCAGLRQALVQWFFVCKLAIVHDALEELSSLSLLLQKRQVSVLTADAHIQNTIEMLAAMKYPN